jgi:hypothetical protein
MHWRRFIQISFVVVPVLAAVGKDLYGFLHVARPRLIAWKSGRISDFDFLL